MDILTRLRVATPAPPAPQPDDPSLPTAKHPVSGDEHHALNSSDENLRIKTLALHAGHPEKDEAITIREDGPRRGFTTPGS